MPDLTPLPLTDDELDELAEITLQDIAAAHSFILKALDKRYKNLLLAEDQELAEEEDDS